MERVVSELCSEGSFSYGFFVQLHSKTYITIVQSEWSELWSLTALSVVCLFKSIISVNYPI